MDKVKVVSVILIFALIYIFVVSRRISHNQFLD